MTLATLLLVLVVLVAAGIGTWLAFLCWKMLQWLKAVLVPWMNTISQNIGDDRGKVANVALSATPAPRTPLSDPLAQAITAATPGAPISTAIAGELFLLRQWRLVWNNGEQELETSWERADEYVARWNIPLRHALRFRAMYWRQRLFSRKAPALYPIT